MVTAIRTTFDEAVSTIRGYERITPDHIYYWSVYLTALEAVAFRAGDSVLAMEINGYRTTKLW
ncbi:MAG TPA: hypothetical protein PK036_16760 [Geobacteraceae bacterium]|nr:hypothetical protein [Geobacteraceae bacterium]